MSKFITIRISLGNDAFAENESGEVARILKDAVNKIQRINVADGIEEVNDSKLYDYNGNQVGIIQIGECV